MSIGHRLAADELIEASVAELYAVLGERDTPRLYQQAWRLDATYDVPCGGGNSLDRKTKYLDRVLYQQAMDGEFQKTGLSPQQLVDCWLDHEHTEICIADGDNSVENYLPSHRRALRKEHERVLTILGHDHAEEKIRNYEAITWPALLRCYHQSIDRPPKDLWCAPFLDEPTERDKEILEIFRRAGVTDAFKRPKYAVHYGFGPLNCDRCRNWNPDFLVQEEHQLAGCRRVTGLVRADRHCDLWMSQHAASA